MKPLNLFTPIAPTDKLHPNFTATLKPESSSVRKVLDEWASGFIDRDGKFVYEFQTTYNSSFWELYLFALTKELKLDVDLSYSSPDFVCPSKHLVIEATIASHSANDTPEWQKDALQLSKADLFDMYARSAIRLSNAFHSKVQKYRDKYRQLEHVKNSSFIIAISNYSRADFIGHGDVPMQWLLYDTFDLGKLKKDNGAEIDLGIFKSDKYSEVSAIIYSAVATFGKARALSDDNGLYLFNAIRIKNNFDIEIIAEPKEKYKETLCDGLRLFINPYAKNPIQISDFDNIGIRKLSLDKTGEVIYTCNPDGDLCMRNVVRFRQKS